MAAITHVYTLACAAMMLGVTEELLATIAENLEPGKDGVVHIRQTPEESEFGFTEFGIDNLRQILDDPPTVERFLRDQP